MKQPPRAALLILDGWGLAPAGPGNCVRLARTPVVDRLQARCPSTTLLTSGRSVGLPEGQMGNSEVGHLTLGAGRVLPQALVRIGDAIEDGSFFATAALVDAVRSANRVHVLGLASDGGVHSHLDHLLALGRAARDARKPFFFHAFTDGRDVSPTSGAGFVRRLAAAGNVATVCGRYYAMDRDKRWERTRVAYQALVAGEGKRFTDAGALVEEFYAAGTTDEFLPACSTGEGLIRDGDCLLFANFRADRARQLTEALTAPEFQGFARAPFPKAAMVTMTAYREDSALPCLFPPQRPSAVLGETFGRRGLANLRVAETEKYAHVTYFFNGGEETPFPGEERVLIPSPKVATYDLKPEMSAAGVASAAVEGVRSGSYRSLILNFANPDMVGHTGSIEATVRACEAVDSALGHVLAALEAEGWAALVTADHGNAECLIDPETGGPHTAHTTNPVPCWLHGASGGLRGGGTLRDIAPTLLGLLGEAVPTVMTGADLRTAGGGELDSALARHQK
ncbi:MAG: 2,3-bisphosphoglycerate-independent phosphoglycerate mutase [Planctomycetaceae bacterium]